jgi:sirohydrochlorin ferrochelatase
MPEMCRAFAELSLMLFAIGSSHSDGPARSLERHARVLDRMGLFRQVRTAVMIGGPSPREALRDLAGRIYIVPMMMCTGWIWSTQIPQALGLSGESCNGARTVRLCDPLGHHPALGPLVGMRARAAARRHGLEPKDTGLLIVAHGTDRDQGSQHATDWHASQLREMGAFAEIETAYLDQAPTIPDTVARLRRPTIISGLFATPGPHAEQDVPQLIAQGNSPNVVDYLGPIGADEGIPEIVLSIVARQVTRHGMVATAETPNSAQLPALGAISD